MAKKIDKLLKGVKLSTFFIGSDGGMAIMHLEVTSDKVVKIGGIETMECTNINTQTSKTYGIKALLKNHNDLVASGKLD